MGLPQGTVTFVFADLEGSTRQWEAHPAEMVGALARHDAIVRGAVGAHGGTVFATMAMGWPRYSPRSAMRSARCWPPSRSGAPSSGERRPVRWRRG
jgi:hypothetical protein